MLDLCIKNGRTVENETIELGIRDGKIVVVGSVVDEPAKETIYLSKDEYISAGWIDDHVHCYEKMTLYYDEPDIIGVSKGVTSVIDAGSTGAENIGDFYELTLQEKTNIFALLNISKWGIVEQDELADLSKIKEDLVKETLAKYPDFVVGIKARMSRSVVGDNDIIPLELAKKIQAENAHLPLMVHIGSAPPELEEVLGLMTKGDILTHCFNGKANGILDQATDTIKDFAWDAYRKGVVFDIGHGTDSFNFHVAEVARKAGMYCASVSTDIYHRNREAGPVYDLATTLEKLMVVGYSLAELMPKITSVPAETFHLKNKGYLKENYDADITIFRVSEKQKELTDSNGQKRTTNQVIEPTKTIIGGVVYDNQ